MSSGSIIFPLSGVQSWKDPVATSASLPATGNTAGDARAAIDTGIIYVWDGAAWQAPSGSGTVTSVGMSVPSFLSVAGSPITTSGTLAVTLATEVKNKVFVGPASGADATPTFRLLVGADLPLPAAATLGGVFSKAAVSNQFLTSISSADGSVGQAQPSFSNLSGTATVAQGGTGLTSGTSGGILGFTASGTLASSVLLTASALLLGGGAGATPTPMGSLGTTTTVLHGNAAGAPTFGAVSLSADVTGTLGVANGGTGLTSGTSGGILAFTASGTLASSGALTASAIVLGGGAGVAPTVLGSLGTTTTVLHGNAAGAPTFGAVSLSADVSGTLPVASGGTNNTTFTAYAVLCAGTTATGAFQNVSGVGTSGYVLTSNGAGALPTWQAGGAPANSTVVYRGATGYGSTATKIVQFTTQTVNTGSDITAASDGTNSTTLTINTAGRYAINLSIGYTGAASRVFITKNQASTSTFPPADAEILMSGITLGGSNIWAYCIVYYLAVNDVIRVANNANAIVTGNVSDTIFSIVRVG